MSSSPVWFITGVSTGFGRNLALRALQSKHNVIGTVRSRSRASDAVKEIEDLGGRVVELEMTDTRENIAKVINEAEGIHGRIDYLINNAGYSILGPVETISPEEINIMMATNVYGPMYAVQAVLPSMRARKSGVIANVTSVGGISALPVCGCYCASKFALEGLTEALATEVAEFNISVLLVEPGSFRTNFGGAMKAPSAGLIDGYKGTLVDKYLDRLTSLVGTQPGDPIKAADRMFEVVADEGVGAGTRSKVLRLVLGTDAIGIVGQKCAKLTQDADVAAEMEKKSSTAFES